MATTTTRRVALRPSPSRRRLPRRRSRVSGATYDAKPHGGTAKVTGVAGSDQSRDGELHPASASTASTTRAPRRRPRRAITRRPQRFRQRRITRRARDSKSFTIAKRAITLPADRPSAALLIWTGSPLTPIYDPERRRRLTRLYGGQITVLGSPTFAPPTVTHGRQPYLHHRHRVCERATTSSRRSAGTVVVFDKSSPTASIISLNPVALNVKPTLVVNFTDVATGNSNIVAWKYSLDGVDQPALGGIGAPSGTITQQLPPSARPMSSPYACRLRMPEGTGVYRPCALLAVYDPSPASSPAAAGSTRPAGAYAADMTLTGKANFGFVSKYQKGATSRPATRSSSSRKAT